MNSLMNYGSDDDCEDSSDEKPMETYMGARNYRKSSSSKQDDANYDEVQMSLSEDSGEESKNGRTEPPRRPQSRDDPHKDAQRRWDVRDSPKPSKRDDRDDRARERHKEDDRTRDRRDERRGKSRERYDRYKDRKDRDRRRSRSPRDRERRRSRSPRRDRSRSRSRGRGGYSKRFDRGNKERFDKSAEQQKNDDKSEGKDRFFVPGITGRFREQIEKRKLLWQKKEPEPQQPVVGAPSAPAGGSRITKVWEATTFAQDTDGKVANKFKRLMGIKNAGEGSNTATDVLKKQEEMFSSMEQQYEVARTATHTMRGVGLGFGSYQR